MTVRDRLIPIMLVCGGLVMAGAALLTTKVLLVYRSVSYAFATFEPPSSLYDDVAFGSEGPGELRGGAGRRRSRLGGALGYFARELSTRPPPRGYG